MFLDRYYGTDADGHILISAAQGSAFAKEVARDFNPIHNPDNRRFCVPGDLLFALALSRYGLRKKMAVNFTDRVGDGKRLSFPNPESLDAAELDPDSTDKVRVTDDSGKVYLDIESSGPAVWDTSVLSSFIRAYVKFSGQTFPFILVPLMREHGVMFNPRRPFVVYASMSISLDSTDIAEPTLELTNSHFSVSGRRGTADFEFAVWDSGAVVGHGFKTLLLSGLQPFDEQAMDLVVNEFNAARDQYIHPVD